MKRLKLYEAFRSESATLTFRDHRLGKDVMVDLTRPPSTLKGGRVIQGVCEWTAELDTSTMGIDGIMSVLRKISLTIEVEDEESDESTEVEIQIPEIAPEQCVRDGLYEWPLHLWSVEIDMRHTEDQSFWKYTYVIGGLGE